MKRLARVTVRVPASTSNLGPGFDCLGLALELYNELTLELYDEPGPPELRIEGEGADSLPRDRSHLSLRAAEAVLAGRHEGRRLVLSAKNEIPPARGLGSSAAAALAGLCAGNRLLGSPLLSDPELLQYAAALEGHPDNAAASLYGGLVLSLKRHKDFECFPLPLDPRVAAVACVPAFELPTQKAREVLPQTVLRGQAVGNAARAMLLAGALAEGRFERLALACEDELHQPYRAPLIPGLREVIRAALSAGASGAALSGAGPTVLALLPEGPAAGPVGEAMVAAFRAHGVASRALALRPDREGVRYLP